MSTSTKYKSYKQTGRKVVAENPSEVENTTTTLYLYKTREYAKE